MFLFLIFFVCACVYLFLRNRRLRGAESAPSIPNVPGLLWSLCTSDLQGIFKKLIEIGECTVQRGGVTKIEPGIISIYFVTSPEDASTVLYRCAEKSFLYDLIKPYVGSQLVAASGTVIKKNRRVLDLSMSSEVLEKYMGIFNKYSTRLVQEMGEKVGRSDDFSDMITRSVLEMVSQTTMGMRLDGKDLITDQYARAVSKELEVLMDRVRYPWLFFDVFFNRSRLRKEQDDALNIIWGLSDKMIEIRKGEHLRRLKGISNEEDFGSFLEIVIKNSVTKDSEVYANEELRNMVDNMMLAGFDTAAAAMLYILVCIGSYPVVQEKLYDELNQVIGPKGRPIMKDDLLRLTYLDAVIKETLRLYPIGPVVARYSTKDIKLEKYTIPAHSQVVVHVWAINRSKSHWGPDAEEFRPERWLDSTPNNPGAFATFAPGKRYCIGKTYAMNMLKTVTAHIVQQYRISADVSKLKLEFVILLKSVGGHMMKLERR